MTEQIPEPTLVEVRAAEVQQYTNNIAMYQQVTVNLPSEWPEHLVQYKDRQDKHQAIAEISDLDDVQLVSELWAHDAAQAAIRAEMVERAKSQAILTVLEAQQP